MKRWPLLHSQLAIGVLAGLSLALGIAGWLIWMRSPERGLPYRDSFAKGKADEWKALGGTWDLVNGTMRNDSDERGAKLLTGSRYWHNYSIEADVYLLGTSGDAGLTIRSGNEEEGVNAYSGYYAGVRTLDNSLVLGRAEHGWMETTKLVPASEGIQPFQWYHLKLLAWNCEIVAAVNVVSRTARTTLAITDPGCASSGRIGLRSYSSGGMWRNVVVRPATHEDLLAMLARPGVPGESSAQGGGEQSSAAGEPYRLLEEQQESAPSNPDTRSIASLRLTSAARPTTATVRGVVILTEPRLYVQDSTGGVYVPDAKAPLLKVGDEVEVTGAVHPGDFSSTMEHGTVHVLWARTPMPPLSVTAAQASTGNYDATFIEIRGHLAGKEHGPGNTLVLNLDEGAQSFRAIMNPGRSDYLYSKLKPNSLLRLRGICVVDPALTHNLTPFVLLLRSNEDLDLIAGPPWWNTGHVIAIVVGILVLALVGVVLYHRVENWRLRAILEERGRLAHEVHDTLAQSFAGIGFQLQAIRNGLPNEMPALHEQLELASNLVRHSHEEARRSIATLRSEKLESEDILSGLETCARRMVAGGSVEVFAEKEGEARPLPLRISDTLYRIGQEAVANAVRHASPTRLTIRLAYAGNAVCLQIEDNGRGFVPGSGLLGFGIRGMRRRAQSVAAALRLESEPGRGTRVTVQAILPPRLTLATWPALLRKRMMEDRIDARPTRTAHSNPYRG